MGGRPGHGTTASIGASPGDCLPLPNAVSQERHQIKQMICLNYWRHNIKSLDEFI